MSVCTFENWWWWRRDGKWDDDNAVRIPNTAWIFCNFHCVCIEWMNEYMQKHFPRTFFLFHSLALEWRDDVDEFNVHGCAGEYLPSSSDIFIILRAFRPFCCSGKDNSKKTQRIFHWNREISSFKTSKHMRWHNQGRSSTAHMQFSYENVWVPKLRICEGCLWWWRRNHLLQIRIKQIKTINVYGKLILFVMENALESKCCE